MNRGFTSLSLGVPRFLSLESEPHLSLPPSISFFLVCQTFSPSLESELQISLSSICTYTFLLISFMVIAYHAISLSLHLIIYEPAFTSLSLSLSLSLYIYIHGNQCLCLCLSISVVSLIPFMIDIRKLSPVD